MTFKDIKPLCVDLEHQLAEARAEIQRWYDDACEASNRKTQDIAEARQEGWEQAKMEAVGAINSLPHDIYSVSNLVPYLSKLEYKEPTND